MQKEMSNTAFQVEERLKKLEREQPLVSRLGEILRKRRVRAVDLLAEWDTGGSGTITRSEFRVKVRQLIDSDEGTDATSDAEVDTLFDSLLANAGPSAVDLPLSALKPAIKHMVEAAAAAEAEKAQLVQSAAEHRRLSAQAKQAITVVQEAQEEEARLAAMVTKQPLMVRLSVAISEWAPEVLIRRWDSNGDGALSRMEFRRNVLKLKLGDATYKEIDELFDALDNGSGEMDLAELKPALARLQKRGADAAGVATSFTDLALQLKETTLETKERAKAMLSATEAAGAAEAAVVKAKESRPLEVRLGEVLLKAHTKASDVMREWDADLNGTLDKPEFRAFVRRALDLPREEAATIDALYDSLVEGQSTLTVARLRPALKRLVDMATSAQAETAALAKSAAQLKKQSREREKACADAAAAAKVMLASAVEQANAQAAVPTDVGTPKGDQGRRGGRGKGGGGGGGRGTAPAARRKPSSRTPIATPLAGATPREVD